MMRVNYNAVRVGTTQSIENGERARRANSKTSSGDNVRVTKISARAQQLQCLKRNQDNA